MSSTVDIVTASVLFTIQLQSSIGAALLVAFECLKYIQQDVYQPRYHANSHKLPKLSKVPIFWILQVLNHISDYQVQSTVGADGYVLLRTLRCLSLLFTIIGMFCLAVLIPIYCSGSNSIMGINSLTMSNIKAGSQSLWVSCGANWIFVVVFLLFYHCEYRCFKQFKSHAALRNMDGFLSPSQSRSIMVVNVPAPYQSSIRLHQLFEQYFPNQVRSACIALNMNDDVQEVIRKRSRYVRKLESSIATYESTVSSPLNSTAQVRPLIVPVPDDGSTTYRAQDVGYISHYYHKVLKYNQIYHQVLIQSHQIDMLHHHLYNVGTEQQECGEESPPQLRAMVHASAPPSPRAHTTARYVHLSDLSSIGFVTFTCRYVSIAACQWLRIDSCYPEMRVFPAPHPMDVIWSNIKYSSVYTDFMCCGTTVLYCLCILGWGAVIGFIAAISSLNYLETFIPALKNISRSTSIFLQGQLSVWALLLVMVLLPMCIRWLSIYVERQKTRSAVDLQVFQWYYLFQMTNVCYTVLAGTTYSLLREVMSNPWSIVPLLAQALPLVSVLFINLLLTMLLSGIVLELLRPIPSLLYAVYSRVRRAKTLTVRAVLEGPLAREYVDYSWIYTQLLYILCIALTYWVIAPLVVVVAGLWFWAQYVLYKYKLCYVLHKQYETGGTYWVHLYSRSMVLLLTTTLLNIGYMAIKQGSAQVSTLTPLPLLIYASWSYTEYQYKDLSSEIPYQQARELSNSSHDMMYDLDVLSEEGHGNKIEGDDTAEEKHATASIELINAKATSVLAHQDIRSNSHHNTTTARREYQAPHLREPFDMQPNMYRINNCVPLFHMRGSDGFSLDPMYYEPPLSTLEEIAASYRL